MILTDREIKIAVERDLITIDPPPDPATAFSSTAVDLTLDPNIIVFNKTVKGVEKILDPGEANASEIIAEITHREKIPASGYLFQPKILMLGWTKEFVRLDIGTRIAARVEGKSSLARLGLAVHVTAPTIHAGFEGQIQLELVNHGNVPIRLKPGMRICQLIFEATLGTPERGYQGQFSGQKAESKAKSGKKKKG
ncbi:MAG TPA: dCTP deaminase [Rhizomicrobium sp.]|nr:dCTP deaminase [Rhizomicrobium sp.]